MSQTSKPYFEDVICAEATPPGVAAISLVRVSGEGSLALMSKLIDRPVEQIESHKALYSKVYDKDSHFIDEVVATFFDKGKSFTGEESFEITCHGSPLIVSSFIDVLKSLGARIAEPGEFSFRSYLNGKIDLTKAEGIHHTIHAKSELSKSLSLNLLEGSFKKQLISIKDLVVWSASRVEASIDFSEQDIDLHHDKEVFSRIQKARQSLSDLLKSYSVGSVQAKGVSVALCGPPNAGKSTLFNLLVDESRSIVSDEAGTTRDYIKQSMSIDGNIFELVDTAGLRDAENKIEEEGIKRSFDLASKAQLILFLVSENGLSDFKGLFDKLSDLDVPMILLETKQDLGSWSSPIEIEKMQFSSHSEENLSELKNKILNELKPYFEMNRNLFVDRHRQLVEKSMEYLSQSLDFTELSGSEDVISSLLYSSIEFLDEILYIDDPEAVRDQIFKDFCLGK